MEPESFLYELRRIIEHLGMVTQPGAKDLPLDNERLSEWKDRTLRSPKFGAMIDLLKQDLEPPDYRDVDIAPYLHIFLSFAYCNQDSGNDALDNAELAVDKFRRLPHDWDTAMAYWFCGIVYRQYPRADAKKELLESVRILKNFVSNNADRDFNKSIKKNCDGVIEQIKNTIENLPNRKPNYSYVASRSDVSGKDSGDGQPQQKLDNDRPSKSAFDNAHTTPAPTGQFREKNKENGESNGTNGPNNMSGPTLNSQHPMNINIHIPVDITATDKFEHTSETSQYTKQSLEQTPINNNLLDSDVLNAPSYTHQIIDLESSSTQSQDSLTGDREDTKQSFGLGYIITPSFPIYGKATAGPNGNPIFGDPDYSGALEEAPLIRLAGKDYKLYPLSGVGNEISVTRVDFLTSLLPPKIVSELNLGGKRYGWLKVIGNSMNKVSPTAIEPDDYVLVSENHDPSACVNKIVVASLPNSELQMPRLVIKKLIRGEYLFEADNKGDKKRRAKFLLHSESKFDVDPVTKEDYKTDLELIRADQIMGIVIAIASDKEKGTT